MDATNTVSIVQNLYGQGALTVKMWKTPCDVCNGHKVVQLVEALLAAPDSRIHPDLGGTYVCGIFTFSVTAGFLHVLWFPLALQRCAGGRLIRHCKLFAMCWRVMSSWGG